MNDSNKIDLKDVNKSNKSFKLPKFNNPFKKQKGPNRDNEGKFATKSGGGGLATVKKFNWKRAAPIIALVTMVGGVFVYQSFAGTANGAFVTEMYQRCHNKMTDSGSGYDYWLGRLDKGEDKNKVWAAFVAASGQPCSHPYPPASTKTTPAPAGTTTGKASLNAAQVTAIYQEVLGRTPSQKDIDYWVDKSKTMTQAQIKATIENTDEAFKKNIEKKLTEARAWKTLADTHLANAKKENEATYKISIQEQIVRADLDLIASKEKYVRDAIRQLQGGASVSGQYYERAIKQNLSQAGELKVIVDSLSLSSRNLNSYLINIVADYKRAQQKYESLLKFYDVTGKIESERIRCEANGGTWQWWRNYCRMPIPPPANPVVLGTSEEVIKAGPCKGMSVTVCSHFSGRSSVNKAPYANPTNYDCSAYKSLYVSMARHGWYLSCVVKTLDGKKTYHDAGSLKLTCPSGYRESAVHTSKNKAGTAKIPWKGKLCQAS